MHPTGGGKGLGRVEPVPAAVYQPPAGMEGLTLQEGNKSDRLEEAVLAGWPAGRRGWLG